LFKYTHNLQIIYIFHNLHTTVDTLTVLTVQLPLFYKWVCTNGK